MSKLFVKFLEGEYGNMELKTLRAYLESNPKQIDDPFLLLFVDRDVVELYDKGVSVISVPEHPLRYFLKQGYSTFRIHVHGNNYDENVYISYVVEKNEFYFVSDIKDFELVSKRKFKFIASGDV